MAKPALMLGRNKGGVWSYSFTTEGGSSMKGRVVVPPSDDVAIERQAVYQRLKALAQALDAAIVDDGKA